MDINEYFDNLRDQLVGIAQSDPHLHGSNFSFHIREEGADYPATAPSMIGQKRMHNIRVLAQDLFSRGIMGDFIETGVWRGGAAIFMAAILQAYNVQDRKVWVCDSFEGLPPPSMPQDAGDTHYLNPDLAISLAEVRSNFVKYNLLTHHVQFVKGFFKDTLHLIPAREFALIRLDGDMYESTIQSLESLYPRLNSGGFVIIDDYGLDICRQAVDDYRRSNNIISPLIKIDHTGVYWLKP